MRVLIAILFVIQEIGNDQNCSTTGEWLNALCFVLILNYHNALRQNEVNLYALTQEVV